MDWQARVRDATLRATPMTVAAESSLLSPNVLPRAPPVSCLPIQFSRPKSYLVFNEQSGVGRQPAQILAQIQQQRDLAARLAGVARTSATQGRYAEAAALFARVSQMLPVENLSNLQSGGTAAAEAEAYADHALELALVLHDWGKVLLELEDVTGATEKTTQARDLILDICFPQAMQASAPCSLLCVSIV
jgi:hypothetical protein